MLQKIKLFIVPFCEATPACLLVMVQGNIWLATIGHLQKAIETGVITGAGVLVLGLFTHRWLSNKFVVAAITGGFCAVADFISHPGHLGSVSTEAIATGALTALLSLLLNFLGKKIFLHTKSTLFKP